MKSINILVKKNKNTSILLFLCALSAAVVLTGCGSSSSSNASSSVSLSGTVASPGGSIAFYSPSKLEQMFANIFGKPAIAAITGVSNVGSGVTIELIEVDAAGTKVGATLASTTTGADGSYTLNSPNDFVPSSKYVIRATGTTESMDVRVSSTTNDVNSVTDAVSDLITTVTSDLTRISVEEIFELQDALDNIAQDVDASSLSADGLSVAIRTEATNNEEVSNQINSTAEAGSICGNVKDAGSSNLANIKILVRDFGNWVTRAKSRTDSSGNYCVSVPDGDYILGALNFTSASTAASEWWHTSGTKYSQIDAEKITVASSASVTKNFSLEAGARIEGVVKTTGTGSLPAGTALEGIQVKLRYYTNFFPLVGKKTKSDGSYRINVIPGTYQVGATNRTLKAYASQYYNAGTGTKTYYKAAPVTMTAGTTTTINFDLEKGYKLSGTILDAPSGNVVSGMRVRVNIASGGPAQRLRTNKEGKYRIWLKSGTFSIQSYGQVSTDLVMTTANATYSPVGPVTIIATNILYNSTGVSQAKAWLLDNSGATVSQEISSSDGSINLYCKVCGTDYKVFVRIDESRDWGSTVFDGKLDITTNFTLVDATQSTMSDINLPAGGTLDVTVTSDGTTAKKNFKTRILTGVSGTDYLIKTQRTHGDGTYLLSLPAGTYRVQMRGDGNVPCAISITAGQTEPLTYRTDTNACG